MSYGNAFSSRHRHESKHNDIRRRGTSASYPTPRSVPTHGTSKLFNTRHHIERRKLSSAHSLIALVLIVGLATVGWFTILAFSSLTTSEGIGDKTSSAAPQSIPKNLYS